MRLKLRQREGNKPLGRVLTAYRFDTDLERRFGGWPNAGVQVPPAVFER